MSKISLLPEADELNGDEQVVLVKNGVTRRSAVSGLVGASVAPFLEDAAASANSAALARDQAATLVLPNSVFIDVPLATAEAAVDVGNVFKLVNSETALVDVRRRTVGGSALLYREATSAALSANDGDTLIGTDDGESGSLWSTIRGFITYIRSALGAAIVGFLASGSGAVARTVLAKLRDTISVKDFGARGDGVTDDSEALQAIFNLISAGQIAKTLVFPSGRYRCDSPLTVDLSYISLRGDCAILDFFYLESGPAVQFIGTANPPWEQSINAISGIRVKGPGREKGVDGIVFHTETIGGGANEGTSHISVYHCNVHGFRCGWTFRSQAYLIYLYGIDTWDCETPIWTPNDIINGGENISFIGGATFNSGLAVKAENTNGAIHFSHHSLDYNQKQIENNGSKVFFQNGHIESGDYPSSPITVTGNGGFVSILGSWLVIPFELPHSFDTFFDIAANCSVVVDKSFANNVVGTDGAWAKGNGNIQVRDLQGFTVPTTPYLQHATRSRLANGYFNGDIGIDNLFITEGGAAITSRHTSTNLTLAIIGGKLVATKIAGVGQDAAFCWAVPVQPGEDMALRCTYEKPGGNSGRMFVSGVWATLDESSATPRLRHFEIFASAPVDFTAAVAPPARLVIGDGAINRAPEWATHFVTLVNGNLLEAGVVMLDAIQMDRGG